MEDCDDTRAVVKATEAVVVVVEIEVVSEIIVVVGAATVAHLHATMLEIIEQLRFVVCTAHPSVLPSSHLHADIVTFVTHGTVARVVDVVGGVIVVVVRFVSESALVVVVVVFVIVVVVVVVSMVVLVGGTVAVVLTELIGETPKKNSFVCSKLFDFFATSVIFFSY